MSQKVGGELTSMQALKKSLDSNAARATELKNSVKSQLGNTVWEGPAATRFRDAWNSEFEPALAKLTEALNEAGNEVQRRKDALERAGS
jgi:WXG100 family type VII secretion target